MNFDFWKMHGTGNDFVLTESDDLDADWPALAMRVCDRHFGVGADGLIVAFPSAVADRRMRIFNPDGSEAEKSGNGLRIFSRFLWDQGLVKNPTFTVETPGGHVQSVIKEGGRLITVAMGSVSFDSTRIPVQLPGAPREVINEKLKVLDREFTYCAATIGNPHCVIPLAEISPAIAHTYGPHLETHPNFPRKTNVQFLRVIDRRNIQIEIWERGAGYTLASGSSSSASAAVAHRLGLVDRSVTVHMPGGTIGIEIGEGYSIMMTGTVNKVAEGQMHPELFAVKV